MVRIIAVANQKGGVGKTTTSINLAASLAAARRRVLLIDLDPQGNATMGSGADKYDLEHSACDVLMKRTTAADTIMKMEAVGYSLMPANSDLTVAEVNLMTALRREYRLQEALAGVQEDYDFIIIDCPPALNMLTVNALVAAHGVIIPMQCEYYALEGLSALVQTIDSIRESVNHELQIHGLLRTMFDPRNNLSTEVSEQLTQHFGERVYRTVIPRNIRLAEAPSHGLPVILYDKSSRGALAYLALAGEILRREGRATTPENVPGVA
ncbi:MULTISPECIES: ParA family protein [Ectothiorhodospira]|jgi:chromosome partitioning protein|uniref:Chromosome partitioning protein n=1 Tax=Ectothiorhodospira marina TaxID=1396821 RepID=A0A1H7JCD5_9GAMM|nr:MULTISPECIES: ParA family protein [Ectothiorhodospira]MCG5514677.1 ParA family protein [Ectothiorhodospira sp. 9100]MCG5518276.1 ParA family protein [Ectothiorhodospira sp. 9905]SEK72102.1 chromosome partitioning protein [Ectothiorhodospira marina]